MFSQRSNHQSPDSEFLLHAMSRHNRCCLFPPLSEASSWKCHDYSVHLAAGRSTDATLLLLLFLQPSSHHRIMASYTHGNTRLPLPLVSWQQATEPRRRCWGTPGSQDDRMLIARVWTCFFTNHYAAVSQPSLWKRPQGMTNTPVAGPAARLCFHRLQIIVCVCLCMSVCVLGWWMSLPRWTAL